MWLLSGSSWIGQEALKGLKKLVVVVVGVASDFSVCPCPLSWFYACLHRTGWVVRYSSIRLFTLAYVGLHLCAE